MVTMVSMLVSSLVLSMVVCCMVVLVFQSSMKELMIEEDRRGAASLPKLCHSDT